MKTLLIALVLMTAIAVGTFSAFKYGLVDKAKDGATSLVDKALGRDDAQPDAVTAAAGERQTVPASFIPSAPAEQPAAVAAATAPAGLRPPSALPQTLSDAPAQTAPVRQQPMQQMASSFVPAAVTVAQASLSNPAAAPVVAPLVVPGATAPAADASASVMPVADVAVSEPARQTSLRPSPSVQAQAQALGQQRAQAAQVREDISAMSAPAPKPALSEAKTRLKAIDQMLSSNPGEALRHIEDLMALPLQPDDAAEAGYRRGYVARLLKDEAGAEQAWKTAAEKYPTLRGGRFSALALGDTWYHRYAGVRPQTSFWDDIQLMYSRALGRDDAPFLPEGVKAQMKEKLNRLNDSLFFGSAPTKLARYHKVEPGELLSGIANKFRVDYESIARVNGIDPNRIRAGMDLKLVVGDVEVVVRKYANDPERQPTLTWYLDGRWMREYPCCVGDGNKTPAGAYTFTSKERFPSWTNPVNGQLLPNEHPENILGSRWMAMRGMNTQGLGIHGTTVNDSIPGYTSAGCVRLLNKDVEELFSFGRIGGKVTIIE